MGLALLLFLALATRARVLAAPAWNSSRQLVFVHVPKTGGWSLAMELLLPWARAEGLRWCATYWQRDEPERASCVPACDAALSAARCVADARVLVGHEPFAPPRAPRATVLVTILRHPVARALSYFRHWRDARHADPSREWAAAHDFGALARAEHGAASAPHARRVSNAMTRQPSCANGSSDCPKLAPMSSITWGREPAAPKRSALKP